MYLLSCSKKRKYTDFLIFKEEYTPDCIELRRYTHSNLTSMADPEKDRRRLVHPHREHYFFHPKKNMKSCSLKQINSTSVLTFGPIVHEILNLKYCVTLSIF